MRQEPLDPRPAAGWQIPVLTHHPLILGALALAIALLTFDVVAAGFAKIGLTRPLVALVLFGSLAGSFVNIPIWSHRRTIPARGLGFVGPYFYYRPPITESRIVAINLGGAIVPAAVSAWILRGAPLLATLAATAAVAVVAHRSARVVPGVGVEVPLLIPPAVAALFAWLLTWNGTPADAASVAYVSGTMGTLIGADILNLRRLEQLGDGVLSIGGAGVFDGVFLAGIVAVLLS